LVLAGVGCAANEPTDGEGGGNTVVQPPGGGAGSVPGGMAGIGVVTPPPGSGIVGPGGGAGTGGDVVTPAGGGVPCAVDTVAKSRCQTCHGASPIGGAPMPLVTLADWQADIRVAFTEGHVGEMMKAYQVAKIRIQPELGTKRMPQGAPLSDPDFAALDGWLDAGATAGTACAAGTAGGGGVGAGGAGAAGSGVVGPPGARNQCDLATNYEPLVARDGETCYEFLTHGQTGASDTSKFPIPPDESYSQLYYGIPWPAGTVATRFGAKFDALAYLHHWLGFSTTVNTPGVVSKNVLGTTLGEGTELVGGWAVGGCNTEFPADVGLKLPDPGSGGIMIQWHHFNTTQTTQMDGSIVQWCTVPTGMRANIGGLTFLGTEYLGMPPGISDVSGTCLNDSGGDITIFGFDPHMHTIGINMKSVIARTGGMDETVFDQPFQFDQQFNYIMDPPVVLKAGESITSTCTFNNMSASTVDFGQSTKQEMCYQFALAYPYGALNNGVLSLIGSTNTCW
jgi:hypothetical protein